MKLNYKVHYDKLDPHDIFNYCATALTDIKRANINARTGFYDRLEESVLRDGFLNPILVTAGWAHSQDPPNHQQTIRRLLPPEMSKDDRTILMCDRNGGSRLWIAQRYDLNIPCIISDYVGRFADLPELESGDEVRKYFEHPPKYVRFDHKGVLLMGLHQL